MVALARPSFGAWLAPIPLFALVLGLLTACESAKEEDQCPAGSGAVFVEDGPQGAGCYCPAGTLPDATGDRCVAGDPCAPWGRTVAGTPGCTDFDECAENTYCSPQATCINVVRDAPRCACQAGYDGDGITCTFTGDCGDTGELVDNACDCDDGFAVGSTGACVDIDECVTNTDD